MNHPTHPGPSHPPPPPTPPPRDLATFLAAEELQRATDGLRETARYGFSSEVEAARRRAAEQAWDRVRGAA